MIIRGETTRILSQLEFRFDYFRNPSRFFGPLTNLRKEDYLKCIAKLMENLEVFRCLMLGIYQMGIAMTWTHSSKQGWPIGGTVGRLTGWPRC
jgi:hypothetical protein